MKQSGEKNKNRPSDRSKKNKKAQSASQKEKDFKERMKEVEFIENNYPLVEYFILFLSNPKVWFRLFRMFLKKEIRIRSKNLFYLILFFSFALTMLLTSFFLTITGLVFWIANNTNNPQYTILILALGLFIAAIFLFSLMKTKFNRLLNKSSGNKSSENY